MVNEFDQVAAWRAVLLTQSRVVRAIERDLDAAGAISLAWYDVLLELNAAPGRQLRMQDLAARVVLSRSRVSRIVTELETAALVERQPDPDDGRAWLATLTAAGRQTLKQTAPLYRPASNSTSTAGSPQPTDERSCECSSPSSTPTRPISTCADERTALTPSRRVRTDIDRVLPPGAAAGTRYAKAVRSALVSE
jgi:DNA-binding MarR family transcriptional regulator